MNKQKSDNVTVLIPVELRDKAHELGFNVSAICRRAVTEVVQRYEHNQMEV